MLNHNEFQKIILRSVTAEHWCHVVETFCKPGSLSENSRLPAAMRHGIGVLLGRKTLQLYVLVLVGVFCYLHYRYLINDTTDVTASRTSGRDLSSLSRPAEISVFQHQPPPQRFVFSLNYWEQLTMATVNLLGLVCLGSRWDAITVQPYTFNSRLYGLRNFKPDDNIKRSIPARPLDLIYDVKSLNDLLLQYKLPKLAPFETFLRLGSRSVVVVHYISTVKEAHELAVMRGEAKEKIEEGFRLQPFTDCWAHLSSYRNTIEKALNAELTSSQQSRDPFRVAKYWCVNMSSSTTPRESAAKMGFTVGDVTVIVVNWRGLGKGKFVRNSVRGFHANNRIAMFNACRHHLSTSWRTPISYSPLVERTAQLFAASLGLSPADEFAAVHIRSEKLGLREPRMPGVTAACFAELMQLQQSMARDYPSLRFIYVTDYSPYSSDTCKKCRGSRDVRQLLQDRSIRTTYFDPAHFNVTVDSGLAAAVESHFLSSASFLLLCGGGGYQNQIRSRFILKQNTHSATDREKAVLRVCIEDSDISRVLKQHPRNLTQTISSQVHNGI